MTGSSGSTMPTCPNGHPAAFEGQRFCEICRLPIGAAAGAGAAASEPPASEPPGPPAAPILPPPPFAAAPFTPVPGAPVTAGGAGGRVGRSQLPLLLGLAVCVALAAGAFVFVAHPFGGGGTPSPSELTLASPTILPTAAGPTDTPVPTDTSAAPTGTPAATPPVAPTAVGTTGPAKWVSAGSISAGRASTRVVALSDGRVLIVGDDNICEPGPAWDSSMAAEVWAAGKWTATGSLNSARDDFTAQPLADGRALVVGGTNTDNISFSSTKIWDPKAGTWADSGLLATARSFPTSALLSDGRVMVIGGEYIKDPTDTFLATAEIFTPATGKWAKAGSLLVARSDAIAITLSDHRVLVAGGYTSKHAVADSEVWDPATGKWTSIGSTPIWGGSALVPLNDGGALLAGGQTAAQKGVATAYSFDPQAGKWVATGKMTTAAYDRTGALLADGKVLMAGGLPDHLKPAIAAAELYDPATGTWTATVSMPSAREESKAIRLADGSILVAGGDGGYIPPVSTPWCPKEITDTLLYIPAVP